MNGWRRGALALLVGVFVMSAMVFHIVAVQTPGLEPPVALAPVFVFVAVTAAIAFPLLWWDGTAGYAASTLAGLLAVVGIVLALLGTFGPVSVGPGPLVYALLGAALVVSSVVAWRRRVATSAEDAPAPTSQ